MNKRIFEVLFFCCLSYLGATAALGQAQRPQAKFDTTTPTDRDELNESFDLNISDRRISERDYEAHTALQLGAAGDSDLRLNVGVAVRAETINVHLRNVRGTVRFHGSLQRVLLRLNSRPATNPPAGNP